MMSMIRGYLKDMDNAEDSDMDENELRETLEMLKKKVNRSREKNKTRKRVELLEEGV